MSATQTNPIPAVSVIIPIYNVEAYLEQCLDSVVAQTLPNIEVICVEDGSSDNSGKIADAYGEKYHNFTVIHKENGGQSTARNAALDIARGEYVYFLDSDDYLEADTLEQTYNAAAEENLDMIFFSFRRIFENDAIRQQFAHLDEGIHHRHDYPGVCTGQTMFTRMNANEEFSVSPCLYLIRRDFLNALNTRFYDGIIHEDNFFTFKCIMSSERTAFIHKPFFCRRFRADSTMTAQKTMRHVEGYLVCYAEALNFLHNTDLVIEEQAVRYINEFLQGVFFNACKSYRQIPPLPTQDKLHHGKADANQLFAVCKLVSQLQIEEELRKQQLEQIYVSPSYRVGRILTWLPRKLRNTLFPHKEK